MSWEPGPSKALPGGYVESWELEAQTCMPLSEPGQPCWKAPAAAKRPAPSIQSGSKGQDICSLNFPSSLFSLSSGILSSLHPQVCFVGTKSQLLRVRPYLPLTVSGMKRKVGNRQGSNFVDIMALGHPGHHFKDGETEV